MALWRRLHVEDRALLLALARLYAVLAVGFLALVLR